MDRRREELFFTASIAEMTGRFDDMLAALCSAAKRGTGLTKKERDLFSKSWRLVIKEKRKSWKIVVRFQKELEKVCMPIQAEKAAQNFRIKLEMEIKETCYNVTEVISKSLIPTCAAPENMVVFYEMIVDCYVSLAETIGEFLDPANGIHYGSYAAFMLRMERKKVEKQALESQEVVREKLCPTSPVRVSTALKTSALYSALYNKLENHNERAKQVVQEALDDVESELKSWSDNKSKIEREGAEQSMVRLRGKLTHLESEKERQQSTGIQAHEAKAANLIEDEEEEEVYDYAKFVPDNSNNRSIVEKVLSWMSKMMD